MYNTIVLMIAFCWLSSTNCNKIKTLYEIIKEHVEATKTWKEPENNSEFNYYDEHSIKQYPGDFDYVIVGAGSGGATLAYRLSEIHKWKVLVIEAGVDENEFSLIPALSSFQTKTSKNWGYKTVPQKYICQNVPDKTCNIATGRGLGGGSSINAMVYSRGDREQFKRWVDLNNTGWCYEDVLPYFKKAENIQFEGDEKYRGRTGPLYVSRIDNTSLIIDSIIEACKELGIEERDPHAEKHTVAYKLQTTTYEGKRWSTNQAYLKKARNHTNLKILTKAFAVKIVFTSDKTVKELHFLQKNYTYSVKPKLELILSAGAINTPQLLMLSGVGPQKDLNSLGINVVKNLPVGQTLADHVINVRLSFSTNFTQRTSSLNESIKEYLEKGTGLLTWTPGLAAQMISTKIKPIYANYSDIQISYGINNDVLDELEESKHVEPKKQIIHARVILLLPQSRGYFSLKSANYTDYPIINPNYFDHPDDIEIMYQGIKAVFKLMNTKTMQRYNASYIDTDIKACEPKIGKEKMQCIIRYTSFSIFHPRGTCMMGPNSQTATVNDKLKVHGIKKLRIVDGSVIPLLTTSGMNSLIIMIAEKIADEIKNEYLKHDISQFH